MRKRKEINVVIFDFDGTLGDVVPLMREIYGQFALKRGYPEITDEIYQDLRKKSLREILKWMGIKPWQIPSLLREGRSVYYKNSKAVLLFGGIDQLMNKLHKDGWHMYILSSNSARTIKEILKRNQLDGYVHILKRPPLFGKAASIKNLIRRHGYTKANVWMVGDEVRDIEAANKAGVKSVAVAWGLQHESALEKAKPTHVAMKVAEVEKYLIGGK